MEVAEERASILVVDDNPLIVNVLRSLFSSQQYQVYCSASGAQALKMLERKQIDVIICDVMMPEMDGYTLHNTVRGRAEYSHIPFVFLTALGSEEEKRMGQETGVDDYIVKPFDPRSLLSIVKGKVTRSRSLKTLAEERYDTYRKRVIHTLSHEFRTPLVAINTGAELLLEQGGVSEAPRVQNLIEAIQRGGQRLERLVSDFMLLQQLEAGIAARLYEQRASLQLLSNVVETVAEAQRDGVQAQGGTISLEVIAADIAVKIYEPHIHDILQRLISNSLKFSEEQKIVELVCYPRAGEAVTEVRDRGLGLDVDRVREAIDTFGQIDRDRLEQQGGGLGLAIASRYASIHGGHLEFERRRDGGSIVSLVLPINE